MPVYSTAGSAGRSRCAERIHHTAENRDRWLTCDDKEPEGRPQMAGITQLALAAAAAASILAPTSAFYLPGVAPHEYKDGDEVWTTTFSAGYLLPFSPSSGFKSLLWRCADFPEGQQALLDENLITLRVLPSAFLQAREGAGLASASHCSGTGAVLLLDQDSCWATHSQTRLAALTPPRLRPHVAGQVENYAENLGEILRGDRIESSSYELAMKHDEYCKVLCPSRDYTKCVAAHALPAARQAATTTVHKS